MARINKKQAADFLRISTWENQVLSLRFSFVKTQKGSFFA